MLKPQVCFGNLKFFNLDKKYGIISLKDSEIDVYFKFYEMKSLCWRRFYLEVDMPLAFSMARQADGRYQAFCVEEVKIWPAVTPSDLETEIEIKLEPRLEELLKHMKMTILPPGPMHIYTLKARSGKIWNCFDRSGDVKQIHVKFMDDAGIVPKSGMKIGFDLDIIGLPINLVQV